MLEISSRKILVNPTNPGEDFTDPSIEKFGSGSHAISDSFKSLDENKELAISEKFKQASYLLMNSKLKLIESLNSSDLDIGEIRSLENLIGDLEGTIISYQHELKLENPDEIKIPKNSKLQTKINTIIKNTPSATAVVIKDLIDKLLFEENVDASFVELERMKLQYDLALELDGKEVKSKLPMPKDDFTALTIKVNRTIQIFDSKAKELSNQVRKEKDSKKKSILEKQVKSLREFTRCSIQQKIQLTKLLELVELIK